MLIASAPFVLMAQGVAGEVFRDFLPSTCAIEAERVTLREVWRMAEDTMAVRRDGNPLLAPGKENPRVPNWSPAAAERVHACMLREWGVPLRGLHQLDAARATLGFENDTSAATLTTQYLQGVGTVAPRHPYVADRPWALMLATFDQAMVVPTRWVAAERTVAELDGMARAGLAPRFLAHFALANAAEYDHDDVRVLRETERLYRLWGAHKADAEEYFPGEIERIVLLRDGALLRQRGMAVAMAAIDSVVNVLAASGHASGNLRRWRELYVTSFGKPAATIRGTWWYHTSDSGRVARPTVGTVTLVYKAYPRGIGWQQAADEIRMLRELSAKYRGRGLEIVTVDETAGTFEDSLFDRAEEEAEYRRHYYVDEHQLPGVLAIWHVKDRRQVSDGRWRSKPSPSDIDYPFGLTLVDARGTIVYGVAQFSPFPYQYLDATIDRLLRP